MAPTQQPVLQQTLLQQTLVELTRTLHARQASPVELMRETLTAVERHNGTYNAVVQMRDAAALLQDAKAAEVRIQRGEGRPLEGIPLGVKDLEDAAGLVTSQGSLPFREHRATQDSTQVARLKAAGAIVVGKTNVPEFGSTAITKNLVYGVTHSPWDAARTPGGSSGGSAAALVSEMLPLITASDAGGSIRIPASFVGAFGIKPSFGRIPTGPGMAWSHSGTVHLGPLTKTVADAALYLDQVVGPDAHDPRSLPHPGGRYQDVLQQPLGRPLRIAYSPDLGYAHVQSDVARVAQQAAHVFETLGHHVEVIQGGPPQMLLHWAVLSAHEVSASIAHLRPAHDPEFGRGLMENLRMAEGAVGAMWPELGTLRTQLIAWCAQLFERYDLLLTPTVPYDPPPARGPLPSETEGKAQPLASVTSFTVPFNLSWNPAASVRAGFSQAGLPVGLQIVGPQHRDDRVLQAAHAFEQAQPWHPHWPLRPSKAA